MEKTTFKDKLGYGISSLGDAICYGLTGAFLLFFLTTVAGISPGIAGTITAVAAVWNAVINPIIGYYADKVHTRFGRRRPMILIFSIPLLLTMFLLFTDAQMPMSLKPAYYGLLLMLYWTSYTGYVVPYMALGADYTSDYDDRTVLRLFSSFFNMIGNIMAMALPTIMVDIIQGFGFNEGQAWSITGLMLGIITFTSNMVTVVASKSKDICKNIEKERKQINPIDTCVDIFKEYVSVAKLKPMRPLIVASFTALTGTTLILSDIVYYFTFNQGMDAYDISASMFIRALMATAFIPLVGKIVIRTDRRETLMMAYIIGSIGLCAVKFLDMGPIVEFVGYIISATICISVYWQIMPGIFYDICEYDRIKNGKDRAATIVSFHGLIEAIAAGVGGQLLGVILEASDFNGAVLRQNPLALSWIENATTVVPVILFVITCIALYKYPLDKKAYNELMKNESKDNI